MLSAMKAKRFLPICQHMARNGQKGRYKKSNQVNNQNSEEFDERLDDDTVLLVNLHFLLSSNINCSEFKHIAYFPEQYYDTYEVLNACDGLVTDYSSVFLIMRLPAKKLFFMPMIRKNI